MRRSQSFLRLFIKMQKLLAFDRIEPAVSSPMSPINVFLKAFHFKIAQSVAQFVYKSKYTRVSYGCSVHFSSVSFLSNG